MKEKIKNLYTAHKYTIWWTISYIAGTYLILKCMFNFSIFSAAQWHKLLHAHLYGFAGFVFGILILAMVPLYVATTAIIIRTQKPLFTIPMPKIPERIKNLFTKPAPVADAEPAPESVPTIEIEAPTTLPRDMPPEMRASYVRARKYGSAFAIAQKNPAAKHDDAPYPVQDEPRPGELPIPTDFDFDTPDTDMDSAPTFSDIPVFSDIDFDAPPQNTDTQSDDYNADVMAHLKNTGRAATVIDDIVLADGMAIASHTDSDFWIADNDAWFAPGKTRPSPIAALIRVAAENNARAILYLGATNIMDLAMQRETWESAGITIITDLGQI